MEFTCFKVFHVYLIINPWRRQKAFWTHLSFLGKHEPIICIFSTKHKHSTQNSNGFSIFKSVPFSWKMNYNDILKLWIWALLRLMNGSQKSKFPEFYSIQMQFRGWEFHFFQDSAWNFSRAGNEWGGACEHWFGATSCFISCKSSCLPPTVHLCGGNCGKGISARNTWKYQPKHSICICCTFASLRQ